MSKEFDVHYSGAIPKIRPAAERPASRPRQKAICKGVQGKPRNEARERTGAPAPVKASAEIERDLGIDGRRVY
ncbi:MAG: hypothetical protein IKD89_07290 [Clostridia bacterium]|nr:hypothetical protein [Clostridia bacterium]